MSITHPELVKALAKPGEAILNELTPNAAHCLHMAVGVSGEVGEIIEALTSSTLDLDARRTNLIEEIGDLEFYMEGLRQGLSATGSEAPSQSDAGATAIENNVIVLLSIQSAHLLDAIKKYSIYVKPVDLVKVQIHMKLIDYGIARIMEIEGLDRQEVLDQNIAKLMVRYSSGSYSNTQAQTRADKADGE